PVIDDWLAGDVAACLCSEGGAWWSWSDRASQNAGQIFHRAAGRAPISDVCLWWCVPIAGEVNHPNRAGDWLEAVVLLLRAFPARLVIVEQDHDIGVREYPRHVVGPVLGAA